MGKTGEADGKEGGRDCGPPLGAACSGMGFGAASVREVRRVRLVQQAPLGAACGLGQHSTARSADVAFLPLLRSLDCCCCIALLLTWRSYGAWIGRGTAWQYTWRC